jgi:hypothetical protein
MTEADWLACESPEPMLGFLQRRPSDRKLRLFGCACSRRSWHLFTDERSRKAVQLGERYADRALSPREAWAVRRGAWTVWRAARGATEDSAIREAARVAVVAVSSPYATLGFVTASLNLALVDAATRGGRETEQEALCSLVRDVFGNPFRPPPLDGAWLRWNGGAVQSLAQAVYEERAFDRLPVLADALEEAGCTDADLLGHCRQPGPHVLGCWAVDLLLGKT